MTPAPFAIATATDAAMEDLAIGLCRSLGPAARDLRVIDIGMSAQARAWFVASGVPVLDAPAEGAAAPVHDRGYFAAMVLRPALPRILGAGAVLWIDADCWVQDPGAIEDFRRAAIAAPAGVAACAMLDPDYEACRTRLVADQDWYRGLHAALFGEEAAAFLYGRATISSGVFCARADAPLWPAWEAQVRRLYQGGPRGELGHMAEQCAFNLVLHQGGGVALLPSMNNWHCHGAPMERRGSRVVVAGSGRAPRIVHLSDFRGMGATYRARRLLFDPDAAPPAGAPGPAAAAVLDELAALRRAHALHRAEAIALRAQLAARQAELEAAGAAASRAASESLDRHRAEMAALRASLSWRVTAPLRALRRGMAAAARRARALPE